MTEPPHAHDPNPAPPSDDPAFRLVMPNGAQTVTLKRLRHLPGHTLPSAHIHSTGHPPSGPFAFGGVTLKALIQHLAPGRWSAAIVLSADGFGTQVQPAEWEDESARPILLAHTIDGQPLSREQGLVRLIVPSETDEALRQVKWVVEVRLLP